MKAHAQPTGGGLSHVWLTHGTPLAAFLLSTTPEHAARITAAVNAPGPVNSEAVRAAVSAPGHLDRRLERRSRCTCSTRSPGLSDGPAADCPRHGDPAVLGYIPLDVRRG